MAEQKEFVLSIDIFTDPEYCLIASSSLETRLFAVGRWYSRVRSG